MKETTIIVLLVFTVATGNVAVAGDGTAYADTGKVDKQLSSGRALDARIPIPIGFEDIKIAGDLQKRALRNFDRMESERYRLPKVFVTSRSNYKWPGDIEGRTLLALVLLSRATGREARHLPEIMQQLPKHLNEKGYFGPVYEGVADEQQLSSHGWVLRGLCEYYLWKHDRQVLEMVKTMTTSLALPLAGYYKTYPIDPLKRKHGGESLGMVTDEQSKWRLSSDIGCAFVFLDGVTHAYSLVKDAELKVLIDKMIARFLEIDLVKIKAQTHSTLTALRSIVRHYEQTGDAGLLKAVEDRYRLYREVAVTESYANYNWFGRPEWTEPCAIIDSFMLAVSLWRHTGKSEYLEDAHHIYFNGLGYGQRPNGGFGTDYCAGAKDPFLKVHQPEAWWCCTMRGGEGLARAIEYSYFTDRDSIIIPFYYDNEAVVRLGSRSIKFKEKTGYPYDGAVLFEVLETSLDAGAKMKFFMPSWAGDLQIKHNGQSIAYRMEGGFAVVSRPLAEGDALELSFSLALRSANTINRNNIAGYHSFRYGPLILGHTGTSEIKIDKNAELVPAGKGKFKVKNTDLLLSPINDLIDLEAVEKDSSCRQILFMGQ